MKPLLIIISGFSCTGKTTLARKIAQEFNLPLVGRDNIKEVLFDSLGWEDKVWSKKLGAASYRLLYYFIEAQLSVGQSLIVESNFQPKFDNKYFQEFQTKYQANILQIYCKADPKILFQRYQERAKSGKRHPGHVDHLNYAEYQENLHKNNYDFLAVGNHLIKVNTTDFNTIDYQKISTTIKNMLNYE